ncbi:MAG: helix-turn-helix domain-containing protein [Actinomycetota bacterium]|nr:helix-turn-helix domain-containing protein [Actinomycetota bacterium]
MLQISQRPLSGSDLDGRLFVDRTTELAATARALDLGFNVLVLGEPKSGRTSFLRRAQRRCADSGRSTVLVDAGAHAAPGDLVAALRRAIGGTASGPAPEAGRGTEITEADVEAMASGSDAGTVVFVDDPTPATANLLFGRFRDVMWQFPHLWVVSGNLARRSEYLQPPADAFFDAVVELGPLDEANARALLLKRIEAAGDSDDVRKLAGALERIVERVTERTPGALLAAARTTLLGGPAGDDAFDHQVARQRRAAVLGRAHAMLLAELESLAPVHAGDDRLLRRLGYTRPRIVQLLKELEAEGVVESRREGRRTMYSPAAPTGGTDRSEERNKR